MVRDIKQNLGKRILELRKQKNLTQTELAQKASYTLIGISQIERGLKFASETMITKLCNALECEPQDLFNFQAQQKILTEHQKKLLFSLEDILKRNPEYIETIFKYTTDKILQDNENA